LDRNSSVDPSGEIAYRKAFFGNYTLQVTGNNNILNSLSRTVMAGKPGFAVYNFKNGDRLNTGFIGVFSYSF